MSMRPSLTTERLLLRPLQAADGPVIEGLLGDPRIAANTAAIPWPYPEGGGAQWIAGHQEEFERGRSVIWGITWRADGTLLGVVALHRVAAHRRAELGYWLGSAWWGRGIATEAARAALGYGLNVLGLQRVTAGHFAHNVASGRVLQKLGMQREGCLRQHILRDGVFHDLVCYGILRDEWRGIGDAPGGSPSG
ncbi:MAG: GNAT family N-acetyltransferase [Anaerolineae bacterium]|jgi:ribosomal-protein-alanine N-acetyltransferase|nr:GNAT family N-acetyltransferase [Chloroflexota bacterium]